MQNVALEDFAAQVQELVLYLREEGHLLSPMDQHVLEQWWEAGYPLDVVLRALHDSGLRLKRRKKPPRGLPLKSLRKAVDKAGERAIELAVGATSAEAEETPAQPPSPINALLLRLRDETGPDPRGEALRCARLELEPLRGESLGPILFSGLLAVARRYYDRRLDALDPIVAAKLRAEILVKLGEGAARLRPEALDETIRELARRELREQDPILDPQQIWSAT